MEREKGKNRLSDSGWYPCMGGHPSYTLRGHNIFWGIEKYVQTLAQGYG